MPVLHSNTTLDVEKEVEALVSRLEAEALDEDMIIGACNRAIELLDSRRQVAGQLIQQDVRARIVDGRHAKMKAGLKGVKPVPLGGPKLQIVDGVIPSRH